MTKAAFPLTRRIRPLAVAFMLALLIGLAPGGARAQGLLEELAAGPQRWYGVGWQNDGQHWSIELLLTPKGAQVAYPSADCAGQWRMLRNLTDRVDYVERIVDGLDTCIATGRVSLSPMPDGRLMYSFSEEPGMVTARAILLPMDGSPRLDYVERLLVTLQGVPLDYLLPDYFQ